MTDLFWITLFLIVIAAILRSEIFFYLIYVVIGLQIAARLWLRRSARALTWRREAPDAAFPNDPVEIRIEVQNRSLVPLPWLTLHESIPPTLRTPPSLRQVLSLGAGERRTISYTVSSPKRGYYRLGPLRLRTGDVLGLGEQALETDRGDTLTIYPRVVPLSELGLPAALPFGVLPASHSLFTDPARPMGVRDYQPGDGMHQVDWKSSARLNRLQVRRHQPAIALETLIALAFAFDEYPGRFPYDEMERAVGAAASIAAHLITHRQPVGLCSTGIDPLSGALAAPLPVATGRAHVIEILRTLGRLEPASHGDLPAMAWQVSAHLGWGSTIVIVIGTCDLKLIEALLPLRRRGLNIALVLVEAGLEGLALARRHGISAFSVNREGRPVAAG